MPDRRDDEEYRRYHEMAEALANVAGILVRVRDTGRLSQRIVDEVRRMFGSLGVLLCRVDPRFSGLRATAVAGDIGSEYDSHVTFAVGMGTPGRAFSEQHPINTADILADPHIRLAPELRAIVERAPFRAVLAVPLVLDDVIIGTLCILDRPGRRFTSEEARFAQTVACQAALALDNARLLEEAEAARAAAMAADQAKDDFLATLGHELRNPLNAMFGWTRMLRTQRLDEQRVGHALEAIDVLVSDLGIPVMDGYDLIHWLRGMERERRRPALPAVALSGFASEEARQRALSAGYHFHEAKPVEPDRLAGLVAEAAKRSVAWGSRSGAMQFEGSR